MALLHTITHTSRIHDILFCQIPEKRCEVLLVGAEDKKVSVYHIDHDTGSSDVAEEPSVVAEMIGHTNRFVLIIFFRALLVEDDAIYRVKAIRTLEIALPASSTHLSTTIACTVSSDGLINIYDIAEIEAEVHRTKGSTTQPAEEDSNLPKQIKPLTSYDSKGTRFTCVTLADGDSDNVPQENGEKGPDKDVESEEDWDGDDSTWGGVDG